MIKSSLRGSPLDFHISSSASRVYPRRVPIVHGIRNREAAVYPGAGSTGAISQMAKNLRTPTLRVKTLSVFPYCPADPVVAQLGKLRDNFDFNHIETGRVDSQTCRSMPAGAYRVCLRLIEADRSHCRPHSIRAQMWLRGAHQLTQGHLCGDRESVYGPQDIKGAVWLGPDTLVFFGTTIIRCIAVGANANRIVKWLPVTQSSGTRRFTSSHGSAMTARNTVPWVLVPPSDGGSESPITAIRASHQSRVAQLRGSTPDCLCS